MPEQEPQPILRQPLAVKVEQPQHDPAELAVIAQKSEHRHAGQRRPEAGGALRLRRHGESLAGRAWHPVSKRSVTADRTGSPRLRAYRRVSDTYSVIEVSDVGNTCFVVSTSETFLFFPEVRRCGINRAGSEYA